jgi:hypothetical protein
MDKENNKRRMFLINAPRSFWLKIWSKVVVHKEDEEWLEKFR